MSEFYLLTHQRIVGPLTGIELREAALSGIIHSECVIGASRRRSLVQGSKIGLFSEEGVPLPHPKDLEIPKCFVRDHHSAAQGPFKLRELIGMAARGMLRPSSEIRLEDSDDWRSVQSVLILASSMNGELVLVNDQGEICRQTEGLLEGVEPSQVREDNFFAPFKFFAPHKAQSRVTVTSVVSASRVGASVAESPVDSAGTWAHTPKGLETPLGHRPANPTQRIRFDQARQRLRSLTFIPRNHPRRLVASAIVLGLVLISIWAWIGQASHSMERSQIVGQWLSTSEEQDAPSFGIAFNEDGRCVIFNTQGDSWSGDFQWVDRETTTHTSNTASQLISRVDEIEAHHQRAEVRPADGYLVLKGFADHPPRIDGHVVRDLFVRRNDNTLMLGYLAEVAYGDQQKKLTAGWVTAVRIEPSSRTDISSALTQASQSDPAPDDRRKLRVCDAIDALQAMHHDNPAITQNRLAALGSRTESQSIDSRFLLKLFGVPDEARPVHPFEQPKLPNGQSFQGSDLVRYGDVFLMLDRDGNLHYISLGKTFNSLPDGSALRRS